MFKFNKKDKEKAQEQYDELLKKVNKQEDKNNGFVLGEKKEIYNSEMSLDDILLGSGFNPDDKNKK